MFTFLPSRDERTIALGIEGTVDEEDAKKIEEYVDEHFGDDEPFNVIAYMNEVESTTFKGTLKGMKFDGKRWNQFQKFAIISDKNWIQAATNIGSILPGVKAKHFKKDEVDEAWGWLLKNEDQ